MIAPISGSGPLVLKSMSIYINLLDIVVAIREILLQTPNEFIARRLNLTAEHLGYQQIITDVLRDIFEFDESRTRTHLSAVTDRLLSLGLTSGQAMHISMWLFQITMQRVISVLPDVMTSELNSYHVTMMNEYDAMICYTYYQDKPHEVPNPAYY